MGFRQAVDAMIDAFDHEPNATRENSLISIFCGQYVFAGLYREVTGEWWNTYPIGTLSFNYRGVRIREDEGNYRSLKIVQDFKP